MAESQNKATELPAMGFLEHLDELRKRLILALVSVVIAFALALTQARRVLGFLLDPILPMLGEQRPVFIDLTEPFLLYMKVALLAALFLSAPFVLYQAWAFVAPGLYPHERRYALPFVLFASAFFLAGGAFGYYVGFPTASQFLLRIAEGFEPALRIKSLFGFQAKIILGLGVVFELPTVIYFLARLGLVTPAFLWRNLKYAVLIIFVIAAVITPTPDVVTQCIFAAPMILLYLLGILVARLFGRPRSAAPQDADER